MKMPKSFKQFLEEGKRISQKKSQFAKLKKREEKYSNKPSEKTMKVADNDKPTSNRLGGGKRITPSNWLKPANKPNPWVKTKTKKQEVENKTNNKQQKIQEPKQKKSGSTLNQKMDKANDILRQSAKDVVDKTKSIGHKVKRITKPLAKTGIGAAKLAGSTISSIDKGIKHQAHLAAIRQSKTSV